MRREQENRDELRYLLRQEKVLAANSKVSRPYQIDPKQATNTHAGQPRIGSDAAQLSFSKPRVRKASPENFLLFSFGLSSCKLSRRSLIFSLPVFRPVRRKSAASDFAPESIVSPIDTLIKRVVIVPFAKVLPRLADRMAGQDKEVSGVS
ncbi:hypothetical protein PHSY_004585 [Pseudozyma hubeiensis SY62]|uniref:Uncharacterized protein n=1 Tax=Pseudozyma hubeiensis (strain SY62) TaxID=1305764 RepID=R9P6L4_PSEHS|nr:hypothetical protein PHSY_004585 [Pseudozyma hubeiensis SY62]GAC97001.1 hypothetical protein PHSY_004585 [Pseudozyma hubeiensis SY62]